jgi:hypothetical protein
MVTNGTNEGVCVSSIMVAYPWSVHINIAFLFWWNRSQWQQPHHHRLTWMTIKRAPRWCWITCVRHASNLHTINALQSSYIVCFPFRCFCGAGVQFINIDFWHIWNNWSVRRSRTTLLRYNIDTVTLRRTCFRPNAKLFL